MRVRIPIVSALMSVALLAGVSLASADQAGQAQPAADQNAAKLKAMRDKMAANRAAAQPKPAEAAKPADPAKPAEAAKPDEAGKPKGKIQEKIDKLDTQKDKLESAQAKIAKKMIADKMEERRKDREQRRREHRKALVAKWGQSVNMPAVREEFRLHYRRMARLHQALEIAQVMENQKAVDRVNKLIALEEGRHDRRLAELVKDAPGSHVGSAPANPGAGTVPAAATKEAK